MPNHMKFCSCKTCRAGRHRSGGKATIKRASRKLRHDTKAKLKEGKEPPDKGTVSYTD